MKEYKTLLDELKKYNPELLKKKRILGISKCDLMDDELQAELRKEMKKNAAKLKGVRVVYFSAAITKGIADLIETLWKAIDK